MIDLEENKRELLILKSKFLSLELSIGKAEEMKKELEELEKKTLQEGFWNDTKSANIVLHDMKEIKNKYSSLTKIKTDLEDLIEANDFLIVENDEEMSLDLIKRTNILKEDIEKLETKMFLSGKFDKNNAIITLHPGARRNGITRLGTNALQNVF